MKYVLITCSTSTFLHGFKKREGQVPLPYYKFCQFFRLCKGAGILLPLAMVFWDAFGFPYRTKDVLRVVDHASPGFSTAAAGFSSHFLLPPSQLGRECQGSMQTNLGIQF